MVYPPEIKFFSSVVYRHDWEVVTIRKHIGSDKALTCACEGVGVDEPVVRGVVVAGLEVVEAGFGVVVVAAVAQGVAVDEAGRGGSPSGGGIRGHVAPGVAGIVPVAAYGCPRPTGSFALDCHVAALLATTGQAPRICHCEACGYATEMQDATSLRGVLVAACRVAALYRNQKGVLAILSRSRAVAISELCCKWSGTL